MNESDPLRKTYRIKSTLLPRNHHGLDSTAKSAPCERTLILGFLLITQVQQLGKVRKHSPLYCACMVRLVLVYVLEIQITKYSNLGEDTPLITYFAFICLRYMSRSQNLMV